MKRIVVTISIVLALVSCNKVELEEPCNCEVTYQNYVPALGEWFTEGTHDGDWDLYPIVTDTLVDCELDGQITYLGASEFSRRQVITCN